MRKVRYPISVALLSGALFGHSLFGQSPETVPQFEIADVHVSAKTTTQFVRTGPVRNGRYEIRTATMLDLVRIAWAFEADKILGGPNWLELDRFDVIAKVPLDSTPEMQRLMLQSLLKDRFQLALHEETKPLPTWALTTGKKLQLKEADGSGETGCKLPPASGPPAEGGNRISFSDASGATTVNLGPGMTLAYSCRNMTMAAFAEGLRTMRFTSLSKPVLDRTGLKGMWNFDVKWSLPLIGPMAGSSDQISLVDALEKQLGLKLEEVPIPTAVLVVDKVDRKPSDNPPGIAQALPAIASPTEFEVADVKLAPTDLRGPMRMGMRPGGRFVTEGIPMRILINRAFNTNNNDQLAGLPSWIDTVRVSITAKAPIEASAGPLGDPEILAPMIRALLVERFGLAWHTEARPVTAYSLVAAKPKLKKADPDSRTFCRNAPPSPNTPPNSQVLICQNTPLALFAERLQNIAQGLNGPVQDATGLDGGWDFTLTFNPFPQMLLNGAGRGGDVGQGAPVAADPGGGYTIFESIEKQLGLKLETQKRTLPVIVIDRTRFYRAQYMS
ncbi:MAG TPA: TIGR03435 family protein [Bryobacteraceae bacterium]|jgi:uncharacterized protein (TIGR03435 family)